MCYSYGKDVLREEAGRAIQTISTLWYIWKARNDKKFNNKTWTAQQIHMHVKANLDNHTMILNLHQQMNVVGT
jgi:hypothetical protein